MGDEVEHIAFLGDLRCGGCLLLLVVIDRRNGFVMCSNSSCSYKGKKFWWPNVTLTPVEPEEDPDFIPPVTVSIEKSG